MKKLSRIQLRLMALGALVALGAGGYYYYARVYLPAQVPAVPTLQTARVRTGDIRVTASGAGNLVPAAELDLGFRTSGVLAEVNVAVGQTVTAGQALARLDDAAAQIQLSQAEINLEQARASAGDQTSAIAEAELRVAAAQAALEDAQAARAAVKNPDVASYQAVYDAAAADLAQAQNAATVTDLGQLSNVVFNAQNALERAADILGRVQAEIEGCPACDPYRSVTVERASYTLSSAQDVYNGALNALTIAKLNLESAQYKNNLAIATAQAAADSAGWLLQAAKSGPSPDDIAVAEAQVRAAEGDLAAAQATLAGLRAGEPPAAVRLAQLSVESAQLALANTTLLTPLAGTVTAVKADVGETVSTAPILTIADLQQLLVRFYVEENDLGKVAVGYPVTVLFDAAPEVPFSGKVVRVDPALVTVDGAPAVQAWAQLDPSRSGVGVLSGMTAEVEIIAGESKNALLVPVQALRELAPGSYAVFVVQPDGQLKLTPVTVGLKDFANAEILAGLQAGDVVSTGTVETK
jgi:HlyD family secretion protein